MLLYVGPCSVVCTQGPVMLYGEPCLVVQRPRARRWPDGCFFVVSLSADVDPHARRCPATVLHTGFLLVASLCIYSGYITAETLPIHKNRTKFGDPIPVPTSRLRKPTVSR